MTVDLSAFYFDIRKDALYCDPISSSDAQGRADRDRSAVPLHRDLARADAVLHRRRGLAVALSGATRRLGASRDVSRDPGDLARRSAGGEVAQDPRPCAASSPARWSSSARRSASAPRSRRRRSSMSRTRSLFAALVDVDLAGNLHHLGGDIGRRRGSGRGVPAGRGRAASRSMPKLAEGTKVRALVEDARQRRLRSRISRRDAARRAGACANGKPCARRRSERAMRLAICVGSPHRVRR